MIKLHARRQTTWDGEPTVVRVSTNRCLPEPLRGRAAFLVKGNQDESPHGFGAYLNLGTDGAASSAQEHHSFSIPAELGYLDEGDIVRLTPRTGQIRVLYRKKSRFNYLLLTEQCNSNCVMCSQPPKDADDSFLVGEYLTAISLMARETPQLMITGGEPTLLGDDLLRIIRACKHWLPDTYLHMLSNGRLFSYLSLCQAVAGVGHPDFMIGIPVYSDIPSDHDFVVQAAGAFDQTIRGILNLKRCKQRVEIRVVLHRHTVPRLPQLAEFITRNLPFVDHIALMGLELMGYTKMNLDALWIDPSDYQEALFRAVETLATHDLSVSIYNQQLCVLRQDLWRYARKSISDWKNEFIEECQRCVLQAECGGFFSSGTERHSTRIRAFLETPMKDGVAGGLSS